MAGCLGACDDVAYASVVLTVVDDQGNVIEAASATFSVDGGEVRPCDSEIAEGFWCGVEVDGDFTITAEAEGYESATTMVTVEADRCHVMTEEIELVLAAAP